jgi:hypothetical protein
MLRTLCVVVILLSAGSAQAQVITCNDRGCSDTAPGVSQAASRAYGAFSAPARFIGGSLKCAVNVNAALAAKGIQGTGSAMAKSFLHWGRASAAVPGAVAVYHRGGRKSRSGHVAIVSRVEGNTVYVLNPGRGGWREVAYPKRAIAYRVAA